MTSGLMLLLAFSAQTVLAGSWLLWADRSARQRRVATRLRAVPSATGPVAATIISKGAAGRTGSAARFASLFGCDWDRRQLYPMRWWLALILVCGAGLLVYFGVRGILGELALAAAPAASVLISRMLFKGWEQARRDRLMGQLADALSMIVRTVSVGVPLAEALKLIARESPEPTSTEFRQLSEEIGIGLPLDEAVLAMAERTGMTEYRFFATTVVLQTHTGGGLSEALVNLADVVSRRVSMRARGYALSSEARTSAKVLTGLPIVVGIGMMFVSPGYMDPLFYTEIGHHMIEGAAVSLTIGALVMRGIIRSELS